MIHYATFSRRLWAFVLSLVADLLVLGVMSLVTGGADVLAPFAFWYVLHHVGLVVEGGTIGHRLVGLRVVSETGERVGVLHAIVRELARLFVSLPPLGLGFLWMLDQPQRRTWHDLLGNSVVVRETALQEAATPEWANDPPWRRAPRDERADAAVGSLEPVSPIMSTQRPTPPPALPPRPSSPPRSPEPPPAAPE